MDTTRYLLAIVILLSLITAGCKKKKIQPQDQSIGNTLAQVLEQTRGQTNSYVVTQDREGNLLSIGDAQVNFNYHYQNNKLIEVDYCNHGTTYQLKLQYKAATLSAAQFLVEASMSEKSVYPITILVKKDVTQLSIFDDYLTLTVTAGNLNGAEINRWYYKQKITFLYGTSSPLTFGKVFPFPMSNFKNIFAPSADHILQAFVQLSAKAFVKNNLQQIVSSNYKSSISQTLNDRQQVIEVKVATEKLAYETRDVAERSKITLSYSYH